MSGQATTDAGVQQTSADQSGNTQQTTQQASVDGQQQQAATDASKQGEQSQEKPQGAPETYETFKLPEGVKLDDAVVSEIQGLAKDLNLTQEQAQKLVDREAAHAQGFEQKFVDRQKADLEKFSTDWTGQSKADKEFGGDALQANLGIARKAMDKFASPMLQQVLKESGLGNNPEVIRLFYRVGKTISEDTFVQAPKGSTPVLDAAKQLYPNLN